MDATEDHYKVKYKDYIVQGGFLFQLSHTKCYPQHISIFFVFLWEHAEVFNTGEE